MTRRLLNLVTAVSLLVGVAAAVLWVRSYWVADAWGWSWETGAVQAGTANGRLRLAYVRLLDGSRYAPPHFAASHYPARLDPPTARLPATRFNLGFGGERQRTGGTDAGLALLPLWFVATAAGGAATLAARGARRRLRAERLRAGLCPSCGYDLTGTPDRCPECGAVAANGAAP